jgi:hypothetical protein
VLRAIFGSKGDGAKGLFRKLFNEELNSLCSLNIVRVKN